MSKLCFWLLLRNSTLTTSFHASSLASRPCALSTEEDCPENLASYLGHVHYTMVTYRSSVLGVIHHGYMQKQCTWRDAPWLHAEVVYLCVSLVLCACYACTVPAVGAMRGCVVPCIRSMLSKLVPADKQGKTLLGVCNTAPISWTDNGSVN